MSSKSWIGLVIGVLALASCDASPPPSPSPTKDAETFINDLATQDCAWELRCCTDMEIKASDGMRFSDAAGCVAYQVLALHEQFPVEILAVREGRMRVDAEQAKACIAAHAARACNPKAGAAPATMDPNAFDPCTRVFTGAARAGDACHASGDCERGSDCRFAMMGQDNGVCVRYQKETEICNDDSDCNPAVPGLYCALQDFHCHRFSRAGEPCAYTSSGGMATLPLLLKCDPSSPLYCDPSTSKCLPLPGDGEPCLPPMVIAGRVAETCNPDPALRLKCDMSGGRLGVCRAHSKLGSSCREFDCDTGLYCTDDTHVCAPLPGLGEACAPYNQGRACAPPNGCDHLDHCAAPVGLGAECDPGSGGISCGADLYCDVPYGKPVGLCRSQFPNGATCMDDEECRSRNCNFVFGILNNPTLCMPSSYEPSCVGR